MHRRLPVCAYGAAVNASRARIARKVSAAGEPRPIRCRDPAKSRDSGSSAARHAVCTSYKVPETDHDPWRPNTLPSQCFSLKRRSSTSYSQWCRPFGSAFAVPRQRASKNGRISTKISGMPAGRSKCPDGDMVVSTPKSTTSRAVAAIFTKGSVRNSRALTKCIRYREVGDERISPFALNARASLVFLARPLL